MLFLREGGVKRTPLYIGLPPIIVGGVRAPMKSTRYDVVTALSVGIVVSSRLHDIDLAGPGPCTIAFVDGQEPYGRPKPIALWECCCHFDPTVLDGPRTIRVNAT